MMESPWRELSVIGQFINFYAEYLARYFFFGALNLHSTVLNAWSKPTCLSFGATVRNRQGRRFLISRDSVERDIPNLQLM